MECLRFFRWIIWGIFERRQIIYKKETSISIIHSLSIMTREQIEEAKIVIKQEGSFNEMQKAEFLTLCDLAIEERRRYQSGKRKV